LAGVAITTLMLATGCGTRDNADTSDQFGSSGMSLSDLERAASALHEPATRRPATPMPQSASPSPMQAASIPSLVSGLEQRLAANPDDASGWALLAQSYAFTGQQDRVEGAIRRAVELGFDESDLRSRVAGATRDPHTGLTGTPVTQ